MLWLTTTLPGGGQTTTNYRAAKRRGVDLWQSDIGQWCDNPPVQNSIEWVLAASEKQQDSGQYGGGWQTD